MKQLSTALTGTASVSVDSSNTAQTVKSGALPVFATPAMTALMEEATCKACEALLDEGETTVGTGIHISHTRASGIGDIITATARLIELDGRRLVLEVEAADKNGNLIGKGTIERFVVLAERFMRKVEQNEI